MIISPADLRAPKSSTEHADLVTALRGSDSWVSASSALLSDLGFRLVAPTGATADGWNLLVALRDPPTGTHFDPELLAYYAPADSGAELVTLDRAVPAGGAFGEPRRVLWGHVHVVDRIPVENRFLTFGGDLRVAAVDPGLTVVELSSPAPIVRWGGHSQATDDLAEVIAAFFSRLIVPVDFVTGAAERIDAVPPGVLYRAFLADGLRRAAAAERHGADRTPLGAWLVAAWHRAREDAAACDAAQRLLRELDLG